MATFPDAAWFEALGRRMAERRETSERLGYAETRVAIRVIGDGGPTRTVGLVLEGYGLASAEDADDVEAFDPAFVVCAPAPVWERMLDEIRVNGRPTRRHTLVRRRWTSALRLSGSPTARFVRRPEPVDENETVGFGI